MPVFALLMLAVVVPGVLLLLVFGKPDHDFVRSQIGTREANDLAPGSDVWYAMKHHH